ncbi:MAG: hypothetical protein AB9891_18110 [Anaerolineaceae bacterium]
MSFLKKLFERNSVDRIYPLVLLVAVLAAYALQVTKMGLYWDDWQVVFLSHPGTPLDFWNYFIFDRPFSAWTYVLTMPLLGTSPLAWQIFTILMRWIAVLGFYWTFSLLWPARRWQVFWMGIFFAVYPGFLQQPISAAFSQHFITYALFTFSLAITLQTIRSPRYKLLFTLLACLFSLVQLLTMEYFFGLEFLRPVLIFLLLVQINSGEKFLKRTLRTLKIWLPYLLVLILFAAWRFGYYPTISAENTPTLLQDFRTSPLHALVQVTQYALQDFLHISYTAWVNAIQPVMIIDKALGLFLAAAVFTLIVAAWFYFSSKSTDEQPTSSESFTIEAVILGVLGILLGGLPVWSTNRQVIVGLWSDRFTLAPMFGAVILLVTVIDWLVQSKNRKIILFSALLFTSLVTQMLNIDRYTANWEVQRSYYWQVYWRAPFIEPGTAVISPKLPMSYISDYTVGYALNAIYDQKHGPSDVKYWFLIGPRAAGDKFADYKPGLSIEYSLRNVIFKGSTSDSLGVSFAAGRECLRVLDPVYYDLPTRLGDDLGGIERDMYPISNVSRISESPAVVMPTDIFGAEPVHDWCYFYQKADLARQMKNWDAIVELGVQAETADVRTKFGPEFIPFIEGYAHLEQWDKAVETTHLANIYTAMMQPGLCATWERIIAETESSAMRSTAILSVQDELSCLSPLK